MRRHPIHNPTHSLFPIPSLAIPSFTHFTHIVVVAASAHLTIAAQRGLAALGCTVLGLVAECVGAALEREICRTLGLQTEIACAMANAVLVKPTVTAAMPCRALNVHHQLQSSSSSSCTLFVPATARRASVKGLVARAAINSSGFWTPEASVPNYDFWSIRNDLEVPSSGFLGEGARAQGGQGPPPMLAERFQSVITQLFQQRIIRCGGAVDDDMANLIVAQLLYLDAADPNRDIVMYVNSPGGSVTAGMAIFDTMRHIRPDVSTVCVGLAASMGAFLLSGGTKGKRYSLPNSRIMIHQPLGGAQGQQTDIEIQANEILHHKANLNGYLAYHTGQPYEKIVQDTDRDFFMSAKEAQEYGLIDAVISNPLKALRPLPAANGSADPTPTPA